MRQPTFRSREENHMTNTHRRLFRVVAAGAVVAALAIPVVASASSGASIQVDSAQLLARGALVDVTVTFTCLAGDTLNGPGSVYLQQAISKTRQASGNGQLPFGTVCTGAPQTLVSNVLAYPNGPPFRLGSAVAEDSIV